MSPMCLSSDLSCRVAKKIPQRFLEGSVKCKAPIRVQFLLTFFGGRGEEQEALDLLSKKKGVWRGL